MTTITEIAEKRKEYEEARVELDAVRDRLEKSDLAIEAENKRCYVNDIAGEIGELENEYKAGMVAEYESTGEKKFDGGQVKIYKTMDYDVEAALQYAIDERALGALSLKSTGFKHLVKSKLPDFVTFGEEAKGTLSADLSEFLIS